MLESVFVPVAVNWGVPPTDNDAFAGVTVMDTSCGELTVSLVAAEIAPSVAVIDVVPGPAVVASPSLPGSLLIMAAVGTEELQVTWVVRSWVLRSLYLPVAVNCCVKPTGTLGLAGVITMETRVAAVTVNVVEALMEGP